MPQFIRPNQVVPNQAQRPQLIRPEQFVRLQQVQPQLIPQVQMPRIRLVVPPGVIPANQPFNLNQLLQQYGGHILPQ